METTLSFVSGRGYLNHNDRTFFSDNVDPERTHNNITYASQTVEEAYERLFADSIERYNDRQSRDDRKKSVPKYLEQIRSRMHLDNAEKDFYEQIVTIGNMSDTGILTNPENAEKAVRILDRYAKTFAERNPNLCMFHATLHLDEATPHLHIDYIPIATGYKKGLDTRNSLSKALEQQGFGTNRAKFDNVQIRWQERERAYLTELAQEEGLTIVKKGVNRPQLSVSEFKALADRELALAASKREELNVSKSLFGKVAIDANALPKAQEIANHISDANHYLSQGAIAIEEEQRKLRAGYTQLHHREKSLDAEHWKAKMELYEQISDLEMQTTAKTQELQAKEHALAAEARRQANDMLRLMLMQKQQDWAKKDSELAKKEAQLAERERALNASKQANHALSEKLLQAEQQLKSQEANMVPIEDLRLALDKIDNLNALISSERANKAKEMEIIVQQKTGSLERKIRNLETENKVLAENKGAYETQISNLNALISSERANKAKEVENLVKEKTSPLERKIRNLEASRKSDMQFMSVLVDHQNQDTKLTAVQPFATMDGLRWFCNTRDALANNGMLSAEHKALADKAHEDMAIVYRKNRKVRISISNGNSQSKGQSR